MTATTLSPTTAAGAAPVFYDDGSHHPEQGTLLGRSYAAGPSGADLFDLPLVATNTALLLFSSITYGFAMIAMQHKRKTGVLIWLAITGLFGLGFLSLELYEFNHLIHEGAGPWR